LGIIHQKGFVLQKVLPGTFQTHLPKDIPTFFVKFIDCFDMKFPNKSMKILLNFSRKSLKSFF